MQQRLEKMYFRFLSKDELADLKEINKLIKMFKTDIEKELEFTFYETYATNMPNNSFDKRDEQNIKSASETVILRDKEGFYGIDENINNTINKYKIELEILHNLITRKEEIMSKSIPNNKELNEQLMFISSELGYGKVREIILQQQDRNKRFVK